MDKIDRAIYEKLLMALNEGHFYCICGIFLNPPGKDRYCIKCGRIADKEIQDILKNSNSV